MFSPAFTLPALGFVCEGFFFANALLPLGSLLTVPLEHTYGMPHIMEKRKFYYTFVLCCRYLLLYELSIFVITCGLPSLTNYGNKEGDIQKRSLICTTSANL